MQVIKYTDNNQNIKYNYEKKEKKGGREWRYTVNMYADKGTVSQVLTTKQKLGLVLYWIGWS